jgi:cbb3-type cytochrome oxidase subunit 1
MIQTDRYSQSIKYFKNAGIVWTFLGLIAGLLNELQLMFSVPGSDSPLSYGNLRAIAVNITIFGGFLSFFLAYALRILNEEGSKEKIDLIARLSFFLLQIGLGFGIAFIAAGYADGRQYGEMNFHTDNMVLLSIAIVLGLSLYNLKGNKLSAAAQFQLVTLSGMVVSFFLGNFGFPNSLITTVAPTSGIQDAVVQEYYRMAVLMFFVYLPLLTILYHAVPEKFHVKIQSQAAVRFQLLVSVLLIPLAGAGALLYSVAPQTLQILGAYTSAALAVSVAAGTVNLHQSFQNSPSRSGSDSVAAAIRLGGLFLTILTMLQFVTRLPIAKHYLQYTVWDDADPYFTATTAGLVVLYTASAMISTNGKKGPSGWVLAVLSAGVLLILPVTLVQGLLEGLAALRLTDDGSALKNPSWAAVSTVSSFVKGGKALQYVASLNGVILLAKLLIFIAFFPIMESFFEEGDAAAESEGRAA